MSNIYKESELLKIYLDLIDHLTAQIKKLIENYKFSSTNDKPNLSNDIEKNFKESERIFKQIELEIVVQGAEFRKNFIKTYEEKNRLLNDLRLMYKKEKENFKFKNKEERLLIKVNSDDSYKGKKNALLLNDSSLVNCDEDSMLTVLNIESNSQHKLNTIARTGIELQNISEGIKKDLHRHSDDILNINQKVRLVNNTIDTSNSMMYSMLSNTRRNKFILGIFSFSLVFTLILIVILRNNSDNSNYKN